MSFPRALLTLGGLDKREEQAWDNMKLWGLMGTFKAMVLKSRRITNMI